MAGYLPSPLGLNPLSARLPSGDVSLWTKIALRQSSSASPWSCPGDESVLTSRKRMLDISILKSLPFLSVPVLEGLFKPLLLEEEEDTAEKKTDTENLETCSDDQLTSLCQFRSPVSPALPQPPSPIREALTHSTEVLAQPRLFPCRKAFDPGLLLSVSPSFSLEGAPIHGFSFVCSFVIASFPLRGSRWQTALSSQARIWDT